MAYFDPFTGDQDEFFPWMSNVETGIRGGHPWTTANTLALNEPFGEVGAANILGQINQLQAEVGNDPQQMAQDWWGKFKMGDMQGATPNWAQLAKPVQGAIQQFEDWRPGLPVGFGIDTSLPDTSLDVQMDPFDTFTPTYQAPAPLLGPTNPQMQSMVRRFEELVAAEPASFRYGRNVWLDPNDLNRGSGSASGYSMQDLLAAEPEGPYSAQLNELLRTSRMDPELTPFNVTSPMQDLLAAEPEGPSPAISPDPMDTFTPTYQVLPPVADEAATDIVGNVAATSPRPENAQVFDFEMPENPLMPQVQEGQQQILDMLMTGGSLPYVSDILRALEDDQRQALDERRASLASRGVLSSTPGMEELDRMRNQYGRARAQTAMQGLQTVLPAYQNAYNQIFNQGIGARQQSISEFLSMLDRQTQMDQFDQTYKNQSLAILLNALGQTTIDPQMPSFNIPNPQPGFIENITTAAANALTTPGFENTILGRLL
jgi:hypothetical protein